MRKPLIITFVAALLLPLGLLAQEEGEDAAPAPLSQEEGEDAAPAPLSSVWFIIPKQGMEAEFAVAAAAEITARVAAGETREWQAYRVVVGHNMDAIQYRACCFNWADQDTHEAQDAELGLSASWGANVGPFVDHYHHYFERGDWENSHWPDEGTSGPLYGVTSWDVKQGAGPASRQAREKLSQIGITEGWVSDENNWLWFTRIGGKPMLAIVSSFENYADMEAPEPSFFEFVMEKLGEEEAGALFSQFGSGFTSSDYTVWEYDASLSTPSTDE